jgi:hypothetical protein
MDYTLNSNDRLQLDQMLKANDVEDKTELIRKTQHSSIIKNEVTILETLKKKNKEMYKNNFEKFDLLAVEKCQFLFNNYTDIYNKVIKNELDLNLLNKFLEALSQIEQGKIDQHEASVKVGTYLKELYIDSALKKAEKNDAKEEKINNTDKYENISWNDFKHII